MCWGRVASSRVLGKHGRNLVEDMRGRQEDSKERSCEDHILYEKVSED